MTLRKLIRITGASALLACAGPVLAKDVELFNADLDEDPSPPNVLFMIDASANWNATIDNTSKKEMEHEALYEIVSDTSRVVADGEDPKLRVGLMQFAEGNNPKGGRVEEAVEGLDESHLDNLQCMLYDADDDGQNCNPADGDENLTKTNNAPYALMMNEMYLYYAGKEPAAGTAKNKDAEATDDDALASDGTYASPQADDVCARSFAVLIGNGEPDSGEDNTAEDKLDALGGVLDSDPIDVTPDQFASNWSDEYARYLSGTDVFDTQDDVEHNVITYVVDVFDTDAKKLSRKEESARAWLESIADQGDGRYFQASNTTEIQGAFDQILNEINAVNDVFASTTLPVSVNVRGTNLNQVYMGVFRPDDNGKPRWQGNLKLYQLEIDDQTGEIFLADANKERADSSVTGFIRDDAVSFWTHDHVDSLEVSEDNYWFFDPRGDPESAEDLPDGPVVEKGAAHQRLRDEHAANGDHTWRDLYTSTGDNAGLEDFDSDNSDVTGIDGLDADVIRWLRGSNRRGTDSNNNVIKEEPELGTSDPRPSIHGDVLHSEPAVVNYGDKDGDGDPDIYTFYGANDGIFHAVRGGKSGASEGASGFGNEVWGFIPQEHLSDLRRLYDNEAKDTDGDGDAFGDRPNFVDGAITVHRTDANDDGRINESDGDQVVIYLSMRRGGRFIYALDVTDPDDPEMLWKKTSSDSNYGELGQTWSAPRVATIEYDDDDDDDGLQDVVIFGGGYDPADDAVPSGTHDQGRAIYVAHAQTGEVIWRASPSADANVQVDAMDYAIPSRITAIDRDFDQNGTVDRLYVGDLGGQVWRVDMNSGDQSDWTVHKLADLPGSGGDGDRKFFFSPDVVFEDNYDAILLGTGDRTHPFPDKQDGVPNEFYMLKDRNQAAAIQDSLTTEYPLTRSQLYDATDGTGGISSSDDGWYLTLNTNELVVGRAVTLAGTVFFNTLDLVETSSATCESNLGIARNYMVDFQDGTATMENDGEAGLSPADRTSTVPGGGFAPAPTPVIVRIDGEARQAVISGTQVHNAPGEKLEGRRRSYWFRQN